MNSRRVGRLGAECSPDLPIFLERFEGQRKQCVSESVVDLPEPLSLSLVVADGLVER